MMIHSLSPSEDGPSFTMAWVTCSMISLLPVGSLTSYFSWQILDFLQGIYILLPGQQFIKSHYSCCGCFLLKFSSHYVEKEGYMDGKWCLSWVMLNLVIRDLSGTSFICYSGKVNLVIFNQTQNSYSLQHDEILVLRYSEVSKQFISSTH